MPSPAVKLPLLVCSSIFTHLNWTAPNPPPNREECAKFNTGTSPQEYGPYTLLDCATLLKRTFNLLNAVEVAAILAHCSRKNSTLLEHIHPVVRRLPDTIPLLGRLLSRLATAGGSVTISKVFVSAFAVMAAGTALRYWAIRTLGRLFTYQLAVHNDHKLVTSGPYAAVRHPSYTGAQVAIVGTALLQLAPGSLWAQCIAAGGWAAATAKAFAIVYVANWAYLWSGGLTRSSREDHVLRQEFGSEWTAWAERTPYRLYPYLL